MRFMSSMNTHDGFLYMAPPVPAYLKVSCDYHNQDFLCMTVAAAWEHHQQAVRIGLINVQFAYNIRRSQNTEKRQKRTVSPGD